MMNFKNVPADIPAPVKAEIERIQKIKQDNYGVVFAVRDIYETVLKVLLLSICYLMEAEDDDCFCKILFLKQMAFGDWINALPSELKKSKYVLNHPLMRKYIKNLVRFYNSSNIIRWRNDYIGHGLMSNPEDDSFFADVETKMNELIGFLGKYSIPEEIMELDFDYLAPFMFVEGSDFFLYESISQLGETFYTNHTTRKRVVRNSEYFKEKRRKYTDVLAVTQDKTIQGEDIYLSEEDKSVDGYHLASFYEKPVYMESWILKILNENDKGVFLMKGGRGTGKSSFVLACDELNQHGEQKVTIRVDDEAVSVRAYYCSRIDISSINDFISYLHEILNVLPNGNRFRSREGNLPDYNVSIAETLSFYRNQYEKKLEREKLILFIDGIDELTDKGWSILNLLPSKDAISAGVYIVLTCRAERDEVPDVVLNFMSRFSFTDSVEFDRRKENHTLMTQILMKQYKFSEEDAEAVATAFDDRLVSLPLLVGQDRQEILNLITTSKCNISLSRIADGYLSRLELRYGKECFSDFIRFLMIVSEGTEGLTLLEISRLSAERNATLKELCFLKDANPFLSEYRSYRGNLFSISRKEYRDYLRQQYSDVFADTVAEWSAILEQFELEEIIFIDEINLDALLYICSNLSEFQIIFPGTEPFSIEKKGTAVLYKIYHICHLVNVADKMHRIRRALRGMTAVISTIEKLIDLNRTDHRLVDLFLECTADAIERAVILREMELSKELAERVNALITDHPKLFYTDQEERNMRLARFYANGMIRFCEEYDTQKAEEYFVKSNESLGEISSYSDELKEKFYEVRESILHNYLGVSRNCKPWEVIPQAQELKQIADRKPISFKRAGEYLMVAMCYKSVHKLDESEQVLRDAADILGQVLCERKSSWENLCDAYEIEIYMTVYWRLCQCVSEKIKQNLDGASFYELKIAIKIMDEFIQYIIESSHRGFGYFDMMRLNFMTTDALLRNSLSVKLDYSCFKAINMWDGRVLTASDIRDESYKIIAMIKQGYRTLKNGGIAYNKIDAMFNLMNCACIYSSFGDQEEGIDLLRRTIDEYTAVNEQVVSVHRILEKKLQELKQHKI